MKIMDKVEEIRKEPEHIRMRYVWFFVGVSMLFVITLWMLSLKASQENSQPAPSGSNLFNSDILNQFGEQKKALDDTQQKTQDALSTLEKTAPNSPQSAGQNNQTGTDLKNGVGQ